MKLTHPDAKASVDTDNPEPYVSQGWVPVEDKKSDDDKSGDKK